MLQISLGIPYIKSICIKGKEYINTDYNPCFSIDLGVPYIKCIKIKGKEYRNLSCKKTDDYCCYCDLKDNKNDNDGNIGGI